MSSDIDRWAPPNDPTAFESLCLDLWKDVWHDSGAQKNGRRGQNQDGVDIFGREDGHLVGVQCKQKDGRLWAKVTLAELEAEVEAARNFQPRLTKFILATTAPRDSALQCKANSLTEQHSNRNHFRVEVWAWEDIWHEIYRRPHVLQIAEKVYWPSHLAYAPAVLSDSSARSGIVAHNLPTLPPHFLPRPDKLNELKKTVCSLLNQPVGLTAEAVRAGLLGMAGIGKSVLAAALAHDREIQCAFPDGVIWLTLGQRPPILIRQSQLAAALGREPRSFVDVEEGRAHLRELLAGKRCLVILDDVWKLQDATAFDIVHSPGQLLLTTRDASVVSRLGAAEVCLSRLSEDEALLLLAKWSGTTIDSLPALTALQLVNACGCLPLAVSMLGARAKGDPEMLKRLLTRMKDNIAAISGWLPDQLYPDLRRAIEVSIDALGDEDVPNLRERYLDFAVFPEDAAIPYSVVELLWQTFGMDSDTTRNALSRLIDLSLMQRRDQDFLIMHDVLHWYVRDKSVRSHASASITDLHTRLSTAYLSDARPRRYQRLDDGYGFLQLFGHLQQAGRTDEIHRLLFDSVFLRSKLQASDLASVLADYARFGIGREAKLVWQAIHMSRTVLWQDARQLAGQLTGRLSKDDGPDIARLLDGITSSDCELVLSSMNPTLRRAGEPLLLALGGHAGDIITAALSASCRRALSASNDGTVKLWDLDRGRETCTFDVDSRGLCALAISSDGKTGVIASHDGSLKILDLEHGRLLRTLSSATECITCMALIHDTTIAVLGSIDATITIIDVDTGRQIHRLIGGDTPLTCLAVTLDGQVAMAGSSVGTCTLWDLKQKIPYAFLKHTSGIGEIVADASGIYGASASRDGCIKVWNLTSGRELCEITSVGSLPVAIALRNSGKTVVALTADGFIRTWDAHRGHEAPRVRALESAVRTAVICPQGMRAIVGSNDYHVYFCDLEAKSPSRAVQPHSSPVHWVATSPDGRRGASCSADSRIVIWDLHAAEVLRCIEERGSSFTAVCFERNVRLAITGAADGAITIWDLEAGEMRHILRKHVSPVTCLALSRDGSMFMSGSKDGTVILWDCASGRQLRVSRVSRTWVHHVALSSNGESSVSASWQTLIQFGTKVLGGFRQLRAHRRNVLSLSFSPNDCFIVSTSDDHTVRIWDVGSGSCLWILKGHRGAILEACWLDGGRRLITSSRDGTIRLWDTNEGKSVRTIHESGLTACCLATADKGRWVLAGFANHTLKLCSLEVPAYTVTFTGESAIECCAMAEDEQVIIAGEQSGRVHILRLDAATSPPFVF